MAHAFQLEKNLPPDVSRCACGVGTRGNALTRLDRFRMPLLLTAGGARGVFTGANEVCRDVLAELAPTMDVTYLELPGYAHSDVWLGRASALALFPSIVSWLERVVATEIRVR